MIRTYHDMGDGYTLSFRAAEPLDKYSIRTSVVFAEQVLQDDYHETFVKAVQWAKKVKADHQKALQML